MLPLWHRDGVSAVALPGFLRSIVRRDVVGDHAVLTRDNLKISFAVHTVWRVDEAGVPLSMERLNTTVTNGTAEKSPDAIVPAPSRGGAPRR